MWHYIICTHIYQSFDNLKFSEAVGAIWALSFDKDNRKVIIEDEALGAIAALSQLGESDCDKIKAAADGALWNLREDLLASQNDTYKAIGNLWK